MVLLPHLSGYRVFDERYNYLFNSYYESVGERQPRPRRGMLTRPTLETVRSYRAHVAAHVADFLGIAVDARVRELIELGCNHDQQNQELFLTDILQLYAQKPLQPH